MMPRSKLRTSVLLVKQKLERGDYWMSTARRDVAIEVEKMRQERVVQKQDQRELSSLKKRVNVEEKEKKAEEYPTGQATVTNRDQNEGGDHFHF